MINTTFPIDSFLSKYISRIYLSDFSDIQSEPFVLLPGSGLELLFHLQSPFWVNNNQCPESHIVCPRTVTTIDRCLNNQYISVRFKCGAFRHFTPFMYSDLNDRIVSVGDLWGNKAIQLEETLRELRNNADRVNCIEKFLIDCFKKYHKTEIVKWDNVISQLHNDSQSILISDLSESVNMSYRNFERNFKYKFGITPKRFARISRLEKTVKSIIRSHSISSKSIFLDFGYYDQSHFVKEFRALSGTLPKQYLQNESLATQYYSS